MTLISTMLLATVVESTAKGKFIARQNASFSSSGEWWVHEFEVTGASNQFAFYFASDYQATAAIFSPSQLNNFKNGNAFTAYALFDRQFGSNFPTLAPGTYYLGVRNATNGANRYSLELDDYSEYPPENGATLAGEVLSESLTVGENGGRSWVGFTVQSGFKYTIDGVNSGLAVYLIPASELSNFSSGRTFQYYTDYSGDRANLPGYSELNLAPGSYYYAFHNQSPETKTVAFRMLRWNPAGGGGGDGDGDGGGGLSLNTPSSWSVNSGQLNIKAASVANSNSGGNSGTLRLEVWFTNSPYSSGSLSGYRVGHYQFSSSLAGGSQFTNIDRNVPYTAPPNGEYYSVMVLTEWDGSQFVIKDSNTFTGTVQIGGGGGGGVLTPPTLASVSINSGVSSTTSRLVTLNHSKGGGTPTHYKASESSSFSGAIWRAYSSAPVFTISSGSGTKRVYLKLKNADGESLTRSDTISYVESTSDDHGNATGAATAVGSSSTTSGQIEISNDQDFFRISIGSSGTLTLNTLGSTDTQGVLFNGSGSQIGENDDTADSLNFRIVMPVTAGTYYVRVKGYDETTTGSYQFVAAFSPASNPPVLSGLSLNNGDASTSSRTVVLNHTKSGGAPVQFIASENASFSGAVWQSYSTTPQFTVSAGNGTKTVHLKLRNADGESASRSDTISYQAQTTDDHGSSIGTATSIGTASNISGNLEVIGDYDYFRLQINAPGELTVTTTGSTDTTGALLNSSGAELASDDDSGSGTDFLISYNVVPGTYYVKVGGYDGTTTGAYQLVSTIVESVQGGDIEHPSLPATAPGSSPVAVTTPSYGKYGGFLKASNGSVLGYFKSIKVSKSSKLSAKMYFGSTSYSLKGLFDESGHYAGVITPRGGSPATVNLQLVRTASGGYKVEGTVAVGGQTANVFAVKSGATGSHAGAYTLLVLGDEDEASAPQGHGYGLMTVTSVGAAKIKGLLGDGSKWTAKCYVSSDGEMPLYAALYGKAGALGGLVRFRNVSGVSDCDGEVHWRKPGGTGILPYSGGFDLQRNLIGSRYSYTGGRVMAGIPNTVPNIEAHVGEGSGDSASSWDLEWTTANKILYAGPEKVKVSVKTQTGQITGGTTDNGTKLKVEGVVFQKQELGAGLVYSKGQSSRSLVIVPKK